MIVKRIIYWKWSNQIISIQMYTPLYYNINMYVFFFAQPHIRVWNSVSLATVVVLGLGEFERSISCLSFSKAVHISNPFFSFSFYLNSYINTWYNRYDDFYQQDGGSLLCAIDEGNDHNISVWDWQKNEKGHKITETKVLREIHQ